MKKLLYSECIFLMRDQLLFSLYSSNIFNDSWVAMAARSRRREGGKGSRRLPSSLCCFEEFAFIFWFSVSRKDAANQFYFLYTNIDKFLFD